MRAIEKWRTFLDKGRKSEASFINFSRVFDCIWPEVLITKLNDALMVTSYGFTHSLSIDIRQIAKIELELNGL